MLVDVESLANKQIREGMSALDTLEALQALGCTLEIRKQHEYFEVELTTPVSNHAQILKEQGVFRATTYHRHLTTAIINLLKLIHDRVQRASNPK